VARPSSDTQRRPISVADFNVRGDGRPNEAAAFQAAINAACAAGVPLAIPRGTYMITPRAGGALRITSALTILADPHAVIKATTGSYSGSDMLNIKSNDVTIDGGDWDWNSSAAGSLSAVVRVGDASLVPSYTNITFRNATFRNAYWACLEIENSELLVDNCRFLDNISGDVNVVIAGASVRNIVVRNSYFRCPATNYEAVNVLNLSGDTQTLGNVQINGNIIEGSLAASVESCAIQLWANAPGETALIKRFTCNDNVVIGFKIGISTAFCARGTVSGNVVAGSEQIGIEGGGHFLAITGNTVDGLNLTRYLIACTGWPDNNISGNVCLNGRAFFEHISVSAPALNTTIVGNKCIQEGALDGVGIRTYGSTGMHIGDNHIKIAGVGSWGMYLQEADDLTIGINTVDLRSTTGGYPIELVASAAVERNNIYVAKSRVRSGTATLIKLTGTDFGPDVDIWDGT
jgi:hypothetical protein